MKPRIIWVSIIAMTIGCWSSGRGKPAGTATGTGPSRGLSGEADALFAKSTVLDYRAPADVEPRHALRLAAAEAYFKACEAGDRRSCWRIAAIKPGLKGAKLVHAGLVRAGRNCLAGDRPSCNALVYHGEELIPVADSYDAPVDTSAARELCKAGLAAGCYAVYNPLGLGEKGDEALVVRGCELGDSMSCAEVAYLASNQVETLERSKEYHRREDAAAKVECERGITRGCRHLVSFGDIDKQQVAATLARACRDGLIDDCTGQGIDRAPRELAIEVNRIACTSLGEGCESLAELVRDDRAAQRDALEHGCHHRQARACALLLRAYREKTLAEPVQGRAASIEAYLCAKRNREHDEEVTAVCADR